MTDIQPHILTLLTSAEHAVANAITALDDAYNDLHNSAYRNLHHVGDEPQDCTLEVDNIQSATTDLDYHLENLHRIRRLADMSLRTQ
jgi:hypothetical protein